MTANSSETLRHTPLYDLHVALGARMVPFAGYAMPVQYEGVKAEHLHTRAAAGLFDVSHMGQVIVQGPGAAQALESLVPADLVDLPVDKQCYTQFLNPTGGIMDDLMITRWDEDRFFLVVNAACLNKDMKWLEGNLEDLNIEVQEQRGLLALQGPAAGEVLAGILPESQGLTFMRGCQARYQDANLYITRSGYTGEDGFEISVPGSRVESLARQLLANPAVRPVGLGARDTLRLEAGLCLYGHDLNEDISPIVADLGWSVSKARRQSGKRPGGFPGDEIIFEELEYGTAQKRVGLKPDGRAPVRDGTELLDENGRRAGLVTSGGYGPSVDAPVAMAYVDNALAAPGTALKAIVRGKELPVTVVTLPFVPHRYRR